MTQPRFAYLRFPAPLNDNDGDGVVRSSGKSDPLLRARGTPWTLLGRDQHGEYIYSTPETAETPAPEPPAVVEPEPPVTPPEPEPPVIVEPEPPVITPEPPVEPPIVEPEPTPEPPITPPEPEPEPPVVTDPEPPVVEPTPNPEPPTPEPEPPVVEPDPVPPTVPAAPDTTLKVLLPNIEPPRMANRTPRSALRLKSGATFADRVASGSSVLYKFADGADSDGLTITDHELDRVGALVRCYNGTHRNILIERISHLNGRYAAGVGRGLFHSTRPTYGVTIRQCVYRSDSPVTSTGDVYGGITLAGKEEHNCGSGFLFEDLDLEGFEINYGGKNNYPNCDAIVVEKNYTDGVVRRVRGARAADGVFDHKGRNWRYEHVTLEHSDKGFRRWNEPSPGGDGPMHCIENGECDLMKMHAGTWEIEHLKLTKRERNAPVVKCENNGGLTIIKSVDLSDVADPSAIVWAKKGDAPKGANRVIVAGIGEFVV